MADANFESFFGVNGGGVGMFPLFPPKRSLNNYYGGSPDGFLGNGDCIQLPTGDNGAGTLQYVNNAGTVVWSKSSTDLNAACNGWVTFNMDAVDNVLWLLGMATTTNTFYLATVNAAGTISVKGSAVATATLALGTHSWGAGTGSGAARRGGGLWRTTPGAGNFTARLGNIEVVFNYLNGAIVSESAVKSGYLAGMFKASNGAYFSPAGIDAANGNTGTTGSLQTLNIIKPLSFNSARHATSVLLAPTSLGLPYNLVQTTGGPGSYAHLQWKGDVFVTPAGLILGSNPVLFDYQEYLAAVDSLMLNFRWDV